MNDGDAMDAEPATPPFARLASDIADVLDALGPDSLDAARGTQERLNLWRQLLDNASSPQVGWLMPRSLSSNTTSTPVAVKQIL